MTHNKSVEDVVEEYFAVTKAHPGIDKKKQLVGVIKHLLQTSQEREREIVGKLFEALDYQNTERELNAKEEDRMEIKLALQQFKLKFLTEYNITLTNPNKD